MRVFKNCLEAFNEVQRDLAELGVVVKTKSYQDKIIEGDEEFATKELQGYSFCIVDSSDKDLMVDNLPWCKAEFSERVADRKVNPGRAWRLRKDVWAEFKHSKFEYTYNERLRGQVMEAVEVLRNDAGSRQAVITIYDRWKDHKNRGGKARIPCSMMYQFMVRDGKLDVVYIMRSCDFYTHSRNDVWMACELRDHIASLVGMERGKFIGFFSSLHGFKKDMEGVF